MMARDIFMGCSGLLLGTLIVGAIGSVIDPAHESDKFWIAVIIVVATGTAAGFIWFGQSFL